MNAIRFLIGALAVSLVGVQGTARGVARGIAVSSSGLCEPCLIAVRVLEDALCDDEAVGFIVETVTNQLCPSTPDPDECVQLATALLPVAIEWLRASETPADLCSAAGVCDAAMLGDPLWDRAPGRLSDGFECPLCKHVVGAVRRDTATVASAAAVRSAAAAACQQLPGELAAACAVEMDKRGPLLRLAVGGAAAGDGAGLAPCELMGMCVSALGRFRAPPLSAALARHLAALSTSLGSLRGSLHVAPEHPTAGGLAAMRDNRCDVCKLAVLEVATLLANPDLQQSALTFAEAACDGALPPSYAPECRALVGTYLPALFQVVQQVLDPDVVCARVRLCLAA